MSRNMIYAALSTENQGYLIIKALEGYKQPIEPSFEFTNACLHHPVQRMIWYRRNYHSQTVTPSMAEGPNQINRKKPLSVTSVPKKKTTLEPPTDIFDLKSNPKKERKNPSMRIPLAKPNHFSFSSCIAL
jgi:hypothetical protein